MDHPTDKPAEPVTYRSTVWPALGLGEMWMTFYPPGGPRPARRPIAPDWKNPFRLLDEPRPRRVGKQGQRPCRAARKLSPP
jgi:hypothetical protein